jgi:HK97 family phage major capsid protein
LRQGQLTGSATAAYTGEAAAITNSQETFGLFSLTAKELAGLVPVSRQFLADASPAADAIVRQDLAQVMGLKMDITMLTATGSSTVPQGILTAAGTTQYPWSGALPIGTNGDQPTYAMVVGMITQLRKSNLPRVNPAWIMPPDLQSALMRVTDGQGRPIFGMGLANPDQADIAFQGNGQNGPDGYMMGIPVYTTTQLPLGVTGTGSTASLALVEMSQVIIGELGDMELDVSTEGTYVTGGTTVAAWQNNLALFRAIMRHDVGLARPSAVVVRPGVIYT